MLSKNHNSRIDELSWCILTFCPGEMRDPYSSLYGHEFQALSSKDVRSYVITKKRRPFSTSVYLCVCGLSKAGEMLQHGKYKAGMGGAWRTPRRALCLSGSKLGDNSKLLNCFRRAVTLTIRQGQGLCAAIKSSPHT